MYVFLKENRVYEGHHSLYRIGVYEISLVQFLFVGSLVDECVGGVLGGK